MEIVRDSGRTITRESLIPELLEREGSIAVLVRHRELALADSMGELDARKCDRRGPERLEPQHRGAASLDRAVILLNDVVERESS